MAVGAVAGRLVAALSGKGEFKALARGSGPLCVRTVPWVSLELYVLNK